MNNALRIQVIKTCKTEPMLQAGLGNLQSTQLLNVGLCVYITASPSFASYRSFGSYLYCIHESFKKQSAVVTNTHLEESTTV